MTLREPLEAPYLRRAAEVHRKIHGKLKEKAIATMQKKDKEKNEEGSKGLGRIVRKLKSGYARPLLYVSRKVQREDGTEGREYITCGNAAEGLN